MYMLRNNIFLMSRCWMLYIMLSICSMAYGMPDTSTDSDTTHADNYGMEVSLLTCEPHDEIYSLYGHTAIRIQDKRPGAFAEDYVVNFGMFDSSAKNFVLRFVFGLTDYRMGVTSYNDFLAEYAYYGCAVHEQHLNLTTAEKERLMAALAENARPENIVYRYNFFYNNCTTKARDIILSALTSGYKLTKEYTPEECMDGDDNKCSFRDLTHWKTTDHPWARVGNDLLLGVAADYNTTQDEREFLPEILMHDFANIRIDDGTQRMLVDSTALVLEAQPSTVHQYSFPLSPKVCAAIFLCIIILISIIERFLLHHYLAWLNYAIACIYGVAGLVLTAMIFSEHPTVRLNLQILVLNPLLPILLWPRLKKKWTTELAMALVFLFFAGAMIQHYAEGMFYVAFALLLIIWKFHSQKFNN